MWSVSDSWTDGYVGGCIFIRIFPAGIGGVGDARGDA